MNAGEEIGGYALVRRLGTGGVGTVWLAEDGAGVPVALKLLHPALAASEAARRRLEREAATVNSVKSPRVAHVVDVETEASQPFIASEYIEGPTLAALLITGPLAPPTLAALAASLAETIRSVHAARIVHRDIKPSNIICSAAGPVLIDFGIAMNDGDEHFTRTGLVSGTAGYTAPELLRAKEADPGSDWWAWAATLLGAATGRPPFGVGDVQALVMRVLAGRADTAGLDPRIAAALIPALAPDPSARPAPEALVSSLLAAFGLPGGVCEPDLVDWAAAFARAPRAAAAEGAGGATELLASALVDPPVEEGALAETRTMPMGEGGVERFGAPPSGGEVTEAVGFVPAAPPAPWEAPPGSSPAGWAGAPDSPWAAASGAAQRDPQPLPWAPLPAPGYAPALPRTSWVLGPVLLMPLAMLPLLLGSVGSVALVAILLVVATLGACLRFREMRRYRAGGKRSSDTAAMLGASPLLLLRAGGGLVLGLGLGALVPYAVWTMRALANSGDPMWARIPALLASPTATIGVDPFITDPVESIALWLTVWAGLVLAYLMPTSVDWRDGTSRFASSVLGAGWIRFLTGALSAGVVVATWVIVTGGLG